MKKFVNVTASPDAKGRKIVDVTARELTPEEKTALSADKSKSKPAVKSEK